MTQAIELKLRQERALLWQARNLHRQFLGDGTWTPCGFFETSEDRLIFEPHIARTGQSSPSPLHGKSNSGSEGLNDLQPTQHGRSPHKTSLRETQLSGNERGKAADATNDADKTVESDRNAPQNLNANQSKDPKSEEVDAVVNDLPQHSESRDIGVPGDGGFAEKTQSDQNQTSSADGTLDREIKGSEGTDQGHPRIDDKRGEPGEDFEMEDGVSAEPPRRMTTRAQTSAGQPQQDPDWERASPSGSSDTLSSLPTPHPLYLVPDSVRPDINYGLPPNEAEDTRRLLWSYVQKQEETVRGFEHMLETLLRACRMKEDVFEWCKAEGHVGEMSDGEDWYDREKWGLAEGEDLKKGADEDDMEPVEESRSNKRGRGRRA